MLWSLQSLLPLFIHKEVDLTYYSSGPWPIGSEQIVSWQSARFTADGYRFTIDDRYTPGTRHAVNVALKSDPSIFCTGTPCTVTADGGAPVQQVPRQKRAFLSIITYNK
ncbi:10644_t:CDS:2 [Funneliformis geosporum]|nr:10644_t:CDS:2 [Funneliformis geosporum]